MIDMPDWAKIKTEYIAQGTPYRELCVKYDVNLRTMARRAKKEEWQRLREEVVNNVNKACQRRAEKNAIQKVTRDVDRFYAASDKLMRKAEQLLDLDEPLSPRDLRSLSSTLLDVRALLGIRDDQDREEQNARIAKLKAEIESLKEDKSVDNRIEVVWVSNPWDNVNDDGGENDGE